MAGGRDEEAFGSTVVTPSTAPVKVDPDDAKLDDAGFGERYDTVRPLARGGMGEVRLVRDRRVGREIAVKVMSPERKVSDEMRARFLREARVQGQLEHPAIVPVYDIGRDENGNEYFTMRRLNGWTLEQILNRLRAGSEQMERQWPQQHLLNAYQQVCLAIDYAHKHGVVHRDLKPANIMLGEYGEVYVLDWGLAKLRDVVTANSINETSSGSSPTSEGQLLGTPGFMSPEQAAGEADVDERADIYALGAILFEILARRPLHEGKSSKDVIRSTHIGANARITERAPERDTAPEFDSICSRAVHLEPELRFQTARELHDAVQRLIDGERDVSLRRRLAEKHADAARAALERALAGGTDEPEQRSAALTEIGQALALAPDDPGVTRMLATLLTTPPVHNPDVTELENESARRAESTSVNVAAIVVIAVFGMMLAVIPLWLGVLSWTWIAAIAIPMVVTGALAYNLHRDQIAGRGDTTWYLAKSGVLTFFAGVAVAGTSGFAGPLLLAPGFAALVAVITAAAARLGRLRWLALLFCCLAIGLPLALEWNGVLPEAYSYRNDTELIVHSAIVNFDPSKTRIALLIVDLALVIIPTLVVWRLVDISTRLREEVQLQKWHLQQLVPAGARAAK